MNEMKATETFGWGLLYHIYNKLFTTKTNVIVCFIHFNLSRRGFRNVGIGEDTSQPAQKEQSELLPDNWSSQVPYRLRYMYNKTLYLLVITDVDEDGDVVINLTRPADNRVAVTTLHIDEIEQLTGTLDEIMPDYGVLMQRLSEDLIDPLIENEASKDTEAQTDDNLSEDLGAPTPGIYHSVHDLPLPVPPHFRFVPPGVGSSDLHPFGRGGGGMIFQPPGMSPRPMMPDPFLPPGAIPPGARFDPIMPGVSPGPNFIPRPRPFPRNSYPDPDHLPPPGYDDMFS